MTNINKIVFEKIIFKRRIKIEFFKIKLWLIDKDLFYCPIIELTLQKSYTKNKLIMREITIGVYGRGFNILIWSKNT